MGGIGIIYTKKLLLWSAVIVAFFVLVEPFFDTKEAYAFRHPDVTALSLSFSSPDAGQAFNSGFTVRFETEDTTDDDIGGALLFRALLTKNGSEGWVGRGSTLSPQEALIREEWCNTEGTNTCGVRIRVADNTGHITQAERFFTIDTAPPKIAISSNRSDPTQKTDVEFFFSAFDEHKIDRIECGLDGQLQSCTSSRKYSTVSPDGKHIFTVRAHDKAGNSAEKSLEWTIDSTPPTTINLSSSAPTYFSQILSWLSATGTVRYDIRYSTAPITEQSWTKSTAIVYNEPIPQPLGNLERMQIGPKDDEGNDFIDLRLGDISNILSANIKHYFSIKTRDKNWNWSQLSNILAPWTNRDPCDYDADRLYSPKNGCGSRICSPNDQLCDFYDYPRDFGLSGNWLPDNPSDKWTEAFGATTKDLDQDGENVATIRSGLMEVNDYPNPRGKDWYDNPFTKDLLALDIKPTLKQLSDTINDLDLDTFVSQAWKEIFDLNEPSEPVDEAELRILAGKNIGGLIYPGARESTCFDCTAYNPDAATGRIPQGKTKSSLNKNRAVGQIEAYYRDLSIGNYETIQQGTINPSKIPIAASANCRDRLDNDLDKGIDSSQDSKDPTRDISCPTTFEIKSGAASRPTGIIPAPEGRGSPQLEPGRPNPTPQIADSKKSSLAAAIFPSVGIVQCGRNADDYSTSIDESADCNICHFFYTVFNIKNLIVSRLMPFLMALMIVAGGFMIALSRGSVDIYQRGRKTIMLAILGYALTLLVWTLISLFFILIGAAKWTGLEPQQGEISGGWWTFTCELSGETIADFSATPDTRNEAGVFSVDFTNLSLGEIRSWSWNFGDGSTSNQQSPRHTYATNGSRVVTLEVKGRNGTGRKIETFHFEPQAAFSASETHGQTPLEVQFEDRSTGKIERWSWDFDGDNLEDSSDQNPQHIYTTPGPYRTKLTVFGPGGRDTESKVSHIFAYPKPKPPAASFLASRVANPKTGTLVAETENLSFSFFLTRFSSTLNPLDPNDHFSDWEWDFGDERGTSAVENPKYFYTTNIKPYTITLKALGPGGDHSSSATIAFPPEANFSANTTNGVLPNSGSFTVSFRDNSLGTVNGWEWNFGDGEVLDNGTPNPAHGYQNNGVFDVILNAKGPEGVNTKRVDNYIKIAPRANFSPSECTSPQGCQLGTEIIFENNSRCSGSCSWYWEFGDGQTSTENEPSYTYPINDIYIARLTVTGPGGSNTAEQKIYVGPDAEFSANPTQFTHPYDSDPGLVDVVFSDSSQGIITDLLLDFGNGRAQKIKEGETLSNSYPLGSYTAVLTATDHNDIQTTHSVVINISQAPPPEPPSEPNPLEKITEGIAEAINGASHFILSLVIDFLPFTFLSAPEESIPPPESSPPSIPEPTRDETENEG